MKEIKSFYNRIIIYLSIIILLIILLFIINKKDIGTKKSFNYILSGDIIYTINNKEGLPVNNSSSNLYVSNSVKDIDIKFNYKFNIDKYKDISYRYDVVASVVSNLDDSSIENSEVFRKEKELFTSDYKLLDQGIIDINNKFIINYDYYNSIASQYNKSVNVPIKSKLYITLNLYIKTKDNKEEKIQKNISFNLEKNTFKIEKSNKETKGSIYVENESNIKLVLNIVISILILGTAVLIGLTLIKFLDYRKKHYIEFKYKKIMQDYTNIVVPINKLPKDKEIVSVNVLHFKSMINIQRELHLPILCYKSDKFIIYLIINNKLAYIYILNSELEKI